MKKGTKPTPTALKKLKGNPGRRPLPADEPKPKSKASKPYGLNKRWPYVAKRWDALAGELDELGLLTGLDVMAFRRLLESDWIASAALAEMRQPDGSLQLIRTDEQGIDRKHPLLQVYRDQVTQFMKLAAEFGLTPSSRTRLKVEGQAEQLSLADEIFRLAEGVK